MPTPPAPPAKKSAVEGIKELSGYLAGTLAAELAQDTDHLNDQSKQLIKFHGSYQQDDRDARKDRHREGAGKAYQFMVRCRIPGGKTTADQYLALDELADLHGNGTLRITSRQGIQFHGIIKANLKKTIRGINDCLLSTLGACGDVERNVMAPAAPFAHPVYRELQTLADRIAEHLAPRSRAYHDIWLDGEKIPARSTPCLTSRSADDPVEPIYSKVYLPRKFKTALALPEDNSVDLYSQDLGFLAEVKDQAVVGFNVVVGGGMGMTHGNANTFPFLARPIGWVRPDQVVAAAEGIIKLFRDHGNRADRKRARLKYVVQEWGVPRFQQVLADYLPFLLDPPKPFEVRGFPLHLGWHDQGDGRFFYGISVENGRIKDEGNRKLRSALRTLIDRWRPIIRLTPMQDILLGNLPATARIAIEQTLVRHGVPLPQEISMVRQHGLACPAIPTCGLALSEAERALPGLIDQLEAELTRLGLSGEAISVRMTGCPNGCVRPYQSDIGIVGRSGDKYTVFVGGNVLGTRLNFVLKDLVPLGEIVPLLSPLFTQYLAQRQPGEGFGDFCHRLGQTQLTTLPILG